MLQSHIPGSRCFYLTLIFLVCIIAESSTQGIITFEKTYGDPELAGGQAVRQTSDGGYILFGVAADTLDYTTSWYLIKTDSTGIVQWEKKYGDEYLIESRLSLQQTKDGGYILCGSLGGPFTDSLVLIKTDSLGNEIWMNTYPESDDRSVGNSVQETNDGGFIVAGYAGRKEDIYIVKTDAFGIEQWRKTYGGSNIDKGYDVMQSPTGDYFVVGVTNSYGNGGYDVFVLKLNSDGDTLWTRTYGTEGNEGGFSMDLTSDGGFITLGIGDTDFYAVKADADGNEMWSKHYGEDGWDKGECVQQTEDGGYFMTGLYTEVANWRSEMHCIKTNAFGDIVWERAFRKGDDNEAHSAQQTTDGGYIILGTTIFVYDSSYSKNYMYLVKIDASGFVTDLEYPEEDNVIKIYPNPFFDFAHIKFDITLNADYTLYLFDAMGKEVIVKSGVFQDEILLERKGLPAGTYFFNIISGNRSIGRGKLIALE